VRVHSEDARSAPLTGRWELFVHREIRSSRREITRLFIYSQGDKEIRRFVYLFTGERKGDGAPP
jgi:hypothetical protein